MEARTVGRPFDLALVVGRMQMFHVGHEHLIHTALSIADRVLVLLGSAQEYGTVRNPFSVVSREKMVRAVFPGDEVIVAPLVDLDADQKVHEAWGIHLLEASRQHTRIVPDVYVYGKEDKNTNWFTSGQNISYLTKDMTEMIVSRERHPISATQMREWMFLDEHAKWAKFANPKLRKYYDELRAELVSCKGLAELVRTQLRRPSQGWTDKPKSVFDIGV